MGTCCYCNQSAGFLRRQHSQCRDLHAEGVQEMVQLAAQAAGTASFNETSLRNTLQAIANRAKATEDDVSHAIPTTGPGRPSGTSQRGSLPGTSRASPPIPPLRASSLTALN